MALTEEEKQRTLKNFMLEHFDFKALCKAGFFTPEMKEDYQAQADRVCHFFGYATVYEYGSKTVSAHISFAGERPKGYEDFVTKFKSIYE